MGQFAIVISGTGNHGCERNAADGDNVLGCQRPDCVDCIAREVVRRLKRNGVFDLKAELVHWPASVASMEAVAERGEETTVERHTAAAYAVVYPQGSSVIDDLVTGGRTGSFQTAQNFPRLK